MTPEDFARFLQFLSPDEGEACRLYARLHKKLVGFFVLRGVSEPTSAADDSIDRAALKIIAGAPVTDAEKYCLGFARNIAHERERLERRESSVFQRFIENLADGADEEIERINRVLKPCFAQLSAKDQELLRAYCQLIRGRARAEHRRQMAERMRTSVQGLRMQVTRLRSVLADCVKRQAGGAA